MATFVEGSKTVGASTTGAASLQLQDSTQQGVTISAKPSTNGDLLADGYPADLEIPIRYIKGMEGDREEARRRWIETLKVNDVCKNMFNMHKTGYGRRNTKEQKALGLGEVTKDKAEDADSHGAEWRREEKVDDILSEPNADFDIIKKYYPHFYFKQAKNGSRVYYEIPGKISLPKLRENGLDLDMLCRHYIYITEFLWKELDTDPEGKLLTCMDMKGAKLSMLAGDVKEFLVRSAKMIGAHYPERSYKIFILNAPWWFSIVWKVVSPFVHRNTRAKINVCGGNFVSALGDLVDLDSVPQSIGGQDPTAPLDSPEEIKMREHMMSILQANGMEMKAVL